MKVIYREVGGITSAINRDMSPDEMTRVIAARAIAKAEKHTTTTANESEIAANKKNKRFLPRETVAKIGERLKSTRRVADRDDPSLSLNKITQETDVSPLFQKDKQKRASKFRAFFTRLPNSMVQRRALGGPILHKILNRKERTALDQGTSLLQKGFSIEELFSRGNGQGQLMGSAFRKKMRKNPHDKTLFRGGTFDIRQFESLNVGDILPIPGSRSFSTDPLIGERFAGMNSPGGDYRRLTNIVREFNPKTGIKQMNIKTPGSYAEEDAMMREMRIDAINSWRQARGSQKNPEARNSAREEYDSLKAMVERNVTGPVRFVCYSDRDIPGVETVRLKPGFEGDRKSVV
jgi:hypothetical protein